jgi:TnpA family transposase
LLSQQRGDHNRLGFACQLTSLRYLGFIPDDLLTPPDDVARLLAHQLGASVSVLKGYGEREQTRSDHLVQVMRYLGFRRATPLDLMALEAWLLERALEHDKENHLLRAALDRLRWDFIVRPGLSSLERLVSAARQGARVVTYQHLSPLLTQERKAFLDTLLITPEGERLTPLGRLQTLPTEANAAQLNDALDKIRFLQEASVPDWNVSTINPNRLKMLAAKGYKGNNQSLQRTAALQRYPILVAFLHESLLNLTDAVLDLVCDFLWAKHGDAKDSLDALRLQAARSTNEKLRTFNQITRLILRGDAAGEDLNETIFGYIKRERLEQLLLETETLVRPANDEAVDFFAGCYGYARKFSRPLLATLSFRSHHPADPVLKAVALIKQLDSSDKRAVPKGAPMSFVSDAWLPYVVKRDGSISRRYYELAVLWALRSALRSGDIFVPASIRYADPGSHLIPKDEWPNRKGEVLRLTMAPPSGEGRLKERSRELQHLAEQVEALHSQDSALRFEDAKWILTPLEADERPASAERLEDELASRLPRLDVPDVILEVNGWTGLTETLPHFATGQTVQGDKELSYLYASLLAQALNHGLTQMSRSTGLPHHQLVYTSNWYLTEASLKAANTALVNYHHSLPASLHWGSGTVSSSDGQRLPLAGKNRQAKSIPKYFGYRRGVTFYSWTSDQFSQYGAKAIPSTVRDATYVLDEILANETDLPVLEHTTDTSGYTEIVFALFDLLGLSFTPRIRDLQDLQLYRTDDLALSELPRVKARLSKQIQSQLVLDMWDEMLRFAGSLKLGYVSASLVIQKLQAAPRKSQLARALQEYGRLIKTIHVLGWYESQEKRRWVTRQLNKGEAVHSLKAFITVGNKGVLRRKTDEGLQNQMLCLNLLTNLIIIWNTVYMTKALEQLEREGYAFDRQDLKHIWPTRSEHINLQGKYFFNLDQAGEAGALRPLRQPGDLNP